LATARLDKYSLNFLVNLFIAPVVGLKLRVKRCRLNKLSDRINQANQIKILAKLRDDHPVNQPHIAVVFGSETGLIDVLFELRPFFEVDIRVKKPQVIDLSEAFVGYP